MLTNFYFEYVLSKFPPKYVLGVIRGPKDLYEYASQELTKDFSCDARGHKPRTFLWVDDIPRPKLQEDLRTLVGTQQLHSIKAKDGELEYSQRACFCEACLSKGETCKNGSYTGKRKIFHLFKRGVNHWMESSTQNSADPKLSANSRAKRARREVNNSDNSVREDDSDADSLVVKKTRRQTRQKKAEKTSVAGTRSEGEKSSETSAIRTRRRPEYTIDGPVCPQEANRLTEQLLNAPFKSKQRLASSVSLQNIVCRKDLSVYGLGYNIDAKAAQLCRESCDVQRAGVFPLLVKADGNCLPRCGSLLAYGSQEYHHDIRIRIALDLINNKNMYLDSAFLSRGLSDKSDMPTPEIYLKLSLGLLELEEDILHYYNQDIDEVLEKGTYMGIYQLFALANVLRRPIRSIYPAKGPVHIHHHVNRLILPMELENDEPVNVMWSSTRDLPDEHWVANHFVILLPLYHRTEAEK